MPKPPKNSTEVVPRPENDRPQRRRWSKEDKLRIVREAEACTNRGDIGALLRREGLYSSLLHQWRHQFHEQGQAGLEAKRVGRPSNQQDRELEQLRRDKSKLEHELKVARAVIELQKKAHELLGIALPTEVLPSEP